MRVELIHIFEAPAPHIAWSKLETILAFVTLKCFFVLLPLSPCINSSSLFCCRGAENLPTILSAGYEVLVFLRRGPAVVVEVAPEPSLFFPIHFPIFQHAVKIHKLLHCFTPLKNATVLLLLACSRARCRVLDIF